MFVCINIYIYRYVNKYFIIIIYIEIHNIHIAYTHTCMIYRLLAVPATY